MFDIPNKWLLGVDYRKTQRKDVLRDMLTWAMGADIIEGFPDLNDHLLDQMVIPVELTERGERIALRAGGDRVVAWAAALSEHGIQVKMFAKSPKPDQFEVMDFNFRRPKGEYTKVTTETGVWNHGIISVWSNSLPDVILDAIR